MASGPLFCTACYWQGYNGKTKTRGSFAAEVVVWFVFLAAAFKLGWLFFLPALLYSGWRLTGKTTVCPGCGHDALIPLESPRAQSIISSYKQEQQHRDKKETTQEEISNDSEDREQTSDFISEENSEDQAEPVFLQNYEIMPGSPWLDLLKWGGGLILLFYLAFKI